MAKTSMESHPKPRPPVPGSPTIPDYGSGLGNGRAGRAKNPRVTNGCHQRLQLATYNAWTLREDEKMVELEVELSKIKWDILGLSEVHREGEDTMTLESGHMLYHREGDQLSQGGVGFLVNKTLVNNVVEISSVSNRVAYLVLKLTERYSLKVVQVYAPTSAYSDTEFEAVYEDISRAIKCTAKTQYTVVMGDFNAKVGVQECDESRVGPHGFGSRNQRGQMLVDFLEREGPYLMNSFFEKQPQRKWTWASPDGRTKNEIDFIMTDKRHIFRDVSVITRENYRADSNIFVQQLGRSHLTKLRSADGNIVASKPEVLAEIEGFYGQLYASHAQKSVAQLTDSRAPLIRHYTDDIPDDDISDIRIAIEQLKNNKAPGEDGITTELLKAGGIAILEQLQRLFNSVLHNGITPEAWSESVVVLFFKKGDKTLLKNYRPIWLLSHVYKRFSRVIANRLAQKLDEFQPPEQAGFRKSFSTIDHIHTVRQIIQKTEEYNQPLCLAFVDYEKAFDSIETWAVLGSLQRCQIDWRYIEVLRCLYNAATMTVQVQDHKTRPIQLQRGVRQ
ncbi:uncharacterized protein LOC125489368, partial [Plutella xylostella]|uniref:uncharacterized protein LOC125489368 n=1 Tax=Plutella xylostella TaxID=51655 RepID=UPI0020330FA3